MNQEYEIIIILLAVLLVLLLNFLLAPLYLMVFNLLASFYFFIYKLMFKSRPNYANPREFWNTPFTLITKFWNFIGKILHGYEVVGLDKIPVEGGALLIFYHGLLPLDAGLFIAKCFSLKKRKPLAIIDRSVHKIPGYKSFIEAMEHDSGTIESCKQTMNKGDLLIIYPGGTKEIVFSDNRYELVWREKAGFATIALETKVPIIPIFTQNIREICGIVNSCRGFFQRLYERKRLTMGIIYGWFPVKLRTIIGDPIYYDQYKSMTNEELVELTKTSLEALIEKHQRIPGSKIRALLDRFKSYQPDAEN